MIDTTTDRAPNYRLDSPDDLGMLRTRPKNSHVSRSNLEMITAREYARSSKGKGAKSRSTEQQHVENLAAGREFSWTWGQAYTDTGSASTYATRNRDDFDRLTADLASGAFGQPGTILVLWEIARLSRVMGVGTKIVDLCEAGGYLIHITSDERTYNPANHNDRHALNAGINDAELEVRRLSKRTKRGVDSNVNAKNDDGDDAARPHGIIPYGYAREYALVDGTSRPVRQFIVPEEAEIIRELYRRVLAGESIRSVALDFQTRGLTGRRGKPFSPATLRVMLMKDAYRGYRSHKGQTLKASWPAIVDDVTWDGVQALLEDPTRRTHTGTAIKHVLTMIVRCGVCSGPMTVAIGKRRIPAYICHDRGCTRILKADADAYLIGDAENPGVILKHFAEPRVFDSLTAERAPETEHLRSQLALKQGQLKAFESEDPETPAEARLIGKKITKLETEIKELEAELRPLSRPRPVDAFLDRDPGQDVFEMWESTPLHVRREIAGNLLSANALGRAYVKRAPYPGAVVPAGERIVLRHGPEDA